MQRRRPGFSSITSQRKEEDEPVIISGIKNNVTDGKPLKMVIKNNNVKSSDYTTLLRPGHAD
jgi:chorismate synthase